MSSPHRTADGGFSLPGRVLCRPTKETEIEVVEVCMTENINNGQLGSGNKGCLLADTLLF